MNIFKKSKSDDMQRLRAAGFTLANADRLSQDRRGGAMIIGAVGAVGLLLVGGIAALSWQPAEKPRASAQADVPQADVVENAAAEQPLETAVNAALLRAAQKRQEAAAAEMAKIAAAEVAAVDVATALAPNTSATVTATTPAATPDCVAQLDSYLEPVFVQFDVGETFIDAQSNSVLAKLGEMIARCSDAYVMVSGHSDSTGDDATNLSLSWARADATVERLTTHGVDPMALEAIGYGARSPLSQGSASDDPENRRVDFRVLRRKGS